MIFTQFFRMKQKTILFILIAVLLVSTAVFLFLLFAKPSFIGLTLSEPDKMLEDLPTNCWKLSDGRTICKLKMVNIEAGQITTTNFSIEEDSGA